MKRPSPEKVEETHHYVLQHIICSPVGLGRGTGAAPGNNKLREELIQCLLSVSCTEGVVCCSEHCVKKRKTQTLHIIAMSMIPWTERDDNAP